VPFDALKALGPGFRRDDEFVVFPDSRFPIPDSRFPIPDSRLLQSFRYAATRNFGVMQQSY
jgi:hypothetical protein